MGNSEKAIARTHGMQSLQTSKIDCKDLGILIAKSFPDIPASVASMAVERIVSKGYGMEQAKELVYGAIDEFIPAYGVAYPSVAYLLGKRLPEKGVSRGERDGVKFSEMDKELVKALLRKYTQAGNIDLDWSWDRMVSRLQSYYDEGGFEL